MNFLRLTMVVLASCMWPHAGLTEGARHNAVSPSIQCRSDQVVIASDARPLVIDVELADTPAKRAKGLMFRQNLADMTGMLFIYDAPRPASFWMKNTLIPLDMVFIDARGVIRHIHENAIPHDETPIPGALPDDPDPNRLMVLEIAGGEADRLGIDVGQVIAHPALPQGIAALPCEG